LGSQRSFEEGAFLAKFILEYDATENNGVGGCELADKAEGCSCEGYIVAFDM
jgi:hypothetical protein